MITRRLFVSFALLTSLVSPLLAEPYTPATGSAERKAICDAVREFVFAKVAIKKPANKVLFKIQHLRVDQGTAWFEGTPVFEDGSYVPTDFLPDMGYMMVVSKTQAGWKVTANLSRSDVPSQGEITEINKQLKNVPSSVMSKFWRDTLHR